MLLIAYDGSDNADAAIDAAAALMPGADAVIITTWQPYVEVMAATVLGGFDALPAPRVDEIDEVHAERAEQVAQRGAARATEAGLTATARAQSTDGGPAAGILTAADDLDPDLIVLGSRGLGRLRAAIVGSTSEGVLHRSSRPVLIVPHAE